MSNPAPARTTNPPQYTRFWRWHLHAALIVIPFVLWQSITGVLYLWHEEIADAMWPQLRWSQAQNVDLDRTAVSLDQQYAAVQAALPQHAVHSIRVAADPRRSTLFLLDDASGLPRPAFVDPVNAQLLGSLSTSTWLPGLTRGLHGGWPLGKPGSWLLELGACWMIIMVLTGVYLWWPRSAIGMAGVLYPRLRAGSRVFWRDLHAVVGMWCSAVILLFLFTALPWTDVWGNQVLRPLQRLTGQTAPAGAASGHDGHAATATHGSALPLQTVLTAARQAGLHGTLEFQLKAAPAPLTVRSKESRASSEVLLQFDRHSGALLGRTVWDNYPLLPKLIATGVDLHEGTFFGRANQWFNTLLVVALLWLVVTGLVGWYRRRPGGGLSPPPRRVLLWPRWLRVSACGLCLFLPLLGLSVLLIWAADRWVFAHNGSA